MSLYELYGILCSQIHGHPWSGPSVLVISKELSPQNTCFLRSLADIVGLQVDEVQGSSDTGAALKLGGL